MPSTKSPALKLTTTVFKGLNKSQEGWQ